MWIRETSKHNNTKNFNNCLKIKKKLTKKSSENGSFKILNSQLNPSNSASHVHLNPRWVSFSSSHFPCTHLKSPKKFTLKI